ncbi:EF-hand domain-containing protein [Pseudoxanthomonas japonensis]|nr:EF-hand domain-containing protein [Pseudoxanthomonas japonensis]
MKSIHFTLLASLLLVSFAADAQQGRGARKQALQERLQSADTDQDGYISRAEADASLPKLAEHFNRIDADRDDRISREELRAAASELAGRRRGGQR